MRSSLCLLLVIATVVACSSPATSNAQTEAAQPKPAETPPQTVETPATPVAPAPPTTETPAVPAPEPASTPPAPATDTTATPTAPAPVPAPVAAEPPKPVEPWTLERYTKVVDATGRKMTMSADTFEAVQKRKVQALAKIEKYLTQRLGSAETSVMEAFKEVPRECFHYNYEGKVSLASSAYESDPKPWGIGYGSALSDYLGQAYMTQLAQPKPGEVALEIGTGSGFQSALLSRICKEVYSIEIIKPLGTAVGKVLQDAEYSNVHTKVGDGYFGWPEVEGGFDIIMVTCAAQHVPPALLEQLKPSGRLLIPVGPPMRGKQVLFVYTKDADGKVHSRRDLGVYFIPMTGAMLEKKKPA